MNPEKFRNLVGEQWIRVLAPFFESKECDAIYARLKADAKTSVICPDSSDTFRAFLECPLDDIKVVIFGQDPYHTIINGVKAADGLAFSSKYTGKVQPSLDKIYDGMEDDLYKGLNFFMEKLPNLDYLANQGVLLLNTSLTVKAKQAGSHRGLWDSFIHYVINYLLLNKKNINFVAIGRHAEYLTNYIWDGDNIGYHYNRHHYNDTEHPAASAYGNRPWKHENIFSHINEMLKIDGKKEIQWALEVAPF